jgi:capsular exopolysaccharide synthesis family protein
MESMDATRTMLLHAAQEGQYKIVMVTSALTGEGKTSLASQLAGSIARAGMRTLVVDGDLRKSTLHRLYDLPLTPGLGEVLRGEAILNDAVRPTSTNDLWVLPTGGIDAKSLQILAQGGIREVFDQLREHYDFVIVDSSPVLPVADALMMAPHVDGVLFAVFRGISRMPAVQSAYERLSGMGVRMLGAVVNGGDSQFYGNAYAYEIQPAVAE